MENQLIFPRIEITVPGYKIKLVHKNVMDIMRKLGGEVANSSYILLEGVPREAYGYYRFPNIGAVMTSLSYSEDMRCVFDVRFLGFAKHRNKFNKIKNYLEGALKRSGLNSVNKNDKQ